MRKLILFIMLLFSTAAQSQIVHTCTFKQLYDKELNTYNEELKLIIEHYENDDNVLGNRAALIKEYIDTLNKNDIDYTKFVEGGKANRVIKDFAITYGRIENDTMKINIGNVFGNEEIEHRIYKEYYNTTFTEF